MPISFTTFYQLCLHSNRAADALRLVDCIFLVRYGTTLQRDGVKMGCAPSKLLRRRRRQIGLREEVPDLQVPTQADWISSGSYVHHDISAFISPAHQMAMLPSEMAMLPSEMAMLPPEDPPPYSEELQDGHITLMRGTQVFKDSATDEACVNSESRGIEQWDSSMVTTRDVSVMSNNSEENTASTEVMLLDAETTNEEFQQIEEAVGECARSADGNEDADSVVPCQAGIHGASTHDNETVDEDVTRHSAVVPSAYIHFYRPLHHRSLSVDDSTLPGSEQLRVPNPRPSQSMTHPEPLSTPFPPKVTLPPITRAPNNISPILTEGWVPNEQFARRPSRLPPLRKRNRVATWHGENSIVMPSASPINSMQQ